MGDLGSKKIGSNYQRLLQISASGMVADGTGSLVSLNISGSEYYTSGSGDGEQEVLKGLTVTGAILPEGSGSWDLGSEDHPFKDLYISSASMKLINVGQLARVKALGGEHYNVSKSLYISEFNKEDVDNLKKGISLKPDRYTQTARVVDHIQTDNYMHLNSSDRIYFNVGGKGMFDLDQDENYIKYGLASPYLGYISPQHIFEGNITASGDISASGTIYADKFESPGSSSVSINDNLIVSGNISFPDGYILGSRSNQILIGSQSKIHESGTGGESDTSYAIAIGRQAEILNSSWKSVAIGYSSDITSGSGVIVGGMNTILGQWSAGSNVLLGTTNYASGSGYSIGIGYGNELKPAAYSIGIGYGTTLNALEGIAIGYRSTITASYAIALGHRATVEGSYSGLINLGNSTKTVSNTDTFVITGRSGLKVGINNSSPTKALDVTGDVNVSGVITGDGSGLTNLAAFSDPFEEDSNGDLMPKDVGAISHHLWMITGSNNSDLCLRPNYFTYPVAAAASFTEEDLNSVVLI